MRRLSGASEVLTGMGPLRAWRLLRGFCARFGVGLAEPVPERSPSTKIPRGAHLATITFLFLSAVGLFRLHLTGEFVLIGNSDRLNTSLNITHHYVDGMRHGRIDAWDEKTLGGINTLGLPYIFPNPLMAVEALFPPSYFLYVAGVVSCLLFACAGWSAYAYLYDLSRSWFAASVAAVLYQFSAISTLKINQNDPSFAVIVLIPLLMLAVRKVKSTRAVAPFLTLSLLFFTMLYFTFLQKAAYATMLVGAYGLYRSIERRTWLPLAVTVAALATAVAGAFPRLATVGYEMSLLQRTQTVWTAPPHTVFSMFGWRFRGAAPVVATRDLLRIFDYGLFGRCPSEAVEKSRMNLSEGMYLYNSAFAVFVIMLGAVTLRRLHWKPPLGKGGEYGFHFVAFALCLAVPYTDILTQLIHLLFLGRDFIHSRILIAALLPMCSLVAVLLRDWGVDGFHSPWTNHGRLGWFLVFALAVLIWGVLVSGNRTTHVWMPAPAFIGEHRFIVKPVVRRLICSLYVFLGLWLASQFRVRGISLRPATGVLMGLLMGVEAMWAADGRVNGERNTSDIPFVGGDCGGNLLLARPCDFTPPSETALAEFSRRLETNTYRSVLQRDFAEISCRVEPHIAELWRLRVIDGYSSGVPACLAALPWAKESLTPRSVSFNPAPEVLQWPFLALLNVKYAVLINDGLLRNRVCTPQGGWREATPDDVRVLTNPLPVVPRVFFPHRIVPSDDAVQTLRQLFAGDAVADVTACSFVQGIDAPEVFGESGAVSWQFDGDRAKVRVDPVAVPRFLVLNERYHPCWHAYCRGREVPIYQTNLFMQGIRLPDGATEIELRFVPFFLSGWSLFCYAGAILCAAAGSYIFRRIAGAKRPPTKVETPAGEPFVFDDCQRLCS